MQNERKSYFNLLSLVSVLAVLTLAILISCGAEDQGFSTKEIEELIDLDQEELFGLELVDDDSFLDAGFLGDSSGGGLPKSSTILFDRVRRRVHIADRQITVELISGDTLANAAVTYFMVGELEVVKGNGDTLRKAIDHPLVRNVIFKRDPDAPRGWRRVAVSLLRGASAQATLIVPAIGYQVGLSDSVSVFDPIRFFIDDLTIPHVTFGDTLIVAAAVANFLQRPLGWINFGKNRERQFRGHARLLFEPGIIGDFPVYVSAFKIGLESAPGVNHMIINMISRRTLSHDDYPYDAILIAVPYVVD